jgi:hypothetical protein
MAKTDKTVFKQTMNVPHVAYVEITRKVDHSTGEIQTERRILPPKPATILRRGGRG